MSTWADALAVQASRAAVATRQAKTRVILFLAKLDFDARQAIIRTISQATAA
jgi:hypothetical protein